MVGVRVDCGKIKHIGELVDTAGTVLLVTHLLLKHLTSIRPLTRAFDDRRRRCDDSPAFTADVVDDAGVAEVVHRLSLF